jgi:hypothetical protein
MVLAQSLNPHLIQRLSLRPPATTLSSSQQCYAKGSYGSPSLLAAWTGYPDTVHILSILFSVGWGHPFLDFVVGGFQAQIVASFV